MVFHEITPEAIAQAVANPRDLDNGLVDAYQTRRVLDRLYGYEVSPVLWKKVMPRLSAGRVQSVATRLVVARERERIAFRPAGYWDLEAIFTQDRRRRRRRGTTTSRSFPARLIGGGRPPGRAGPRLHPGRRAAQRRPAVPAGGRARTPAAPADPAGVVHLLTPANWRGGCTAFRSASSRWSASRTGAPRTRRSAPRRCSRRRPASSASPPSTRCRWRSGCTRTATSPICGPTRSPCRRRRSTRPAPRPASCTGREYVPDAPRIYTSKVKNAQEAHEAIRPGGRPLPHPAADRAVRR